MLTLLILFILAAIVASVVIQQARRSGRNRTAQIAGLVRGVSLALAVVVILFASVVVINPGEVGVQVLFGDVKTGVLTNGLHLINPLVEVVRMDVKTQSYTMSGVISEGQRQGDDAIVALSRDGLTIKLDVTVLYHLVPDEAPNVYKNIGLDYIEKIVRPEVRTVLRDRAVNYIATDLYSMRRDEFVTGISKQLEEKFQRRGIMLEQVLLRNVVLPDKVKEAIDEKIAADQDAQKMVYVLQKEQKEAERKKVEAEGIATAQKIIANSLTPMYLQWNYIQTLKSLVNSQNSTFVITPYDQKLTPMLNVPAPSSKK